MKSLSLAAAAAFAGVCALAHPAQAQRVSRETAQALAQRCSSNDPRQVEACEAYIDGVADTLSFYQLLRPADGSKGGALPAYVCVPKPTTGIQLRENVLIYFRKHQNEATRQASGAVLRALDDIYPCPGGQPRVVPSE